MEGGKVSENHLTSAAAFVEGGVQDACDDACSICLEAFSDNDPSSVTVCRHEFHLQCILEWGQRSSQCPMCWQSLSLKDPNSQELFDAVEHERNIRMNPPRNTTIFRHPTLGDFELQHVCTIIILFAFRDIPACTIYPILVDNHLAYSLLQLPVSSTDSELEERIIQHLAAAAAMGRARHLARRGGQRGRASSQGHPHFLVFSTNPNPSPTVPAFSTQRTGGEPTSPVPVSGSTPPVVVGEGSGQFVALPSSAQTDSISGAGLSAGVGQLGTSSNNNWGSPSQSSPHNQNRAGPSDFQSFSESIKSRLSAMSMRYKESITKSTRGWKERFFSRNNSMQDHDGSEARNEVSSDLATVSCLMEHPETRETSRTPVSPLSNRLEEDLPHLLPDRSEQQISEIDANHSLSEGNSQTPCTTSSSH